MVKIGKLTPEQEKLLSLYRDKWLKIGLSAEPGDEKIAEEAIRESYKEAGLSPPDQIIWCDSPLSLVISDSIVCNKSNSVRDSVSDSVWDSVRASVRDSVRASVWASVWASVRDSVKASIWDSVRASVWDSVRASVRASVWDSVRASVRASVWDSVYGQQDAHWLGFYNYFAEILSVEEAKKLENLNTIAKHCNWWIPRKTIALVSRKPTCCSINENGLLHSEADAAIKFKDDFSVYAINGVRIPKEVVLHPKQQTIKEIREEENIEIKRIRISRYGWDRFLTKIRAKVVDFSSVRLEYGGDFLEALYHSVEDDITALATYDPSTGRPYFLEVPSDIKTCSDAQNYLLAKDTVLEGINLNAKINIYPKLRT